MLPHINHKRETVELNNDILLIRISSKLLLLHFCVFIEAAKNLSVARLGDLITYDNLRLEWIPYGRGLKATMTLKYKL